MSVALVLVFICFCMAAWSMYIQKTTNEQTTWSEWLVYGVFVLSTQTSELSDKVVTTILVVAVVAVVAVKVFGLVADKLKYCNRQIRYCLATM